MQRIVIDHIPLRVDSAVLDIGCGTGWGVMEAAKRAPGGRICGVDISPGMIQAARGKIDGSQNVDFQVADAEELPYSDGSFDFVFSTFSFHHYSEPLKALGEIKRVLKKGGQVYVLDNDRTSFWGFYRLWDFYFKMVERGHVGYYSPKQLMQVFTAAGFSDVALVYNTSEFLKNGKLFGSAMIVQGVKR
jgi:ubiquinone/menaquinone biosynthesis C-methylase UbiE